MKINKCPSLSIAYIIAVLIELLSPIAVLSASAGQYIKIADIKIPADSFSMEDSVSYILPNGMEFILKENHTNPIIASVVIVKVGSRDETLRNNGVSHLIEHMLFNGTATRTQEDIYNTIDYLGGYNNAHTTKDYTTYLMVMPSEHIETGLNIQSDMLFNSIIPEEKLEKEKGIVIEEIAKDKDNPEYLFKNYYDNILFKYSSYSLPVLGTSEQIKRLTREDVLDYYKAYYLPNNMIGLIVGDFDINDMIRIIETYFAKPLPAPLPKRDPIITSPLDNSIYTTYIKDKLRYMSISLPAPSISTAKEFFAFTILNRLISQRLNEYGFSIPDKKSPVIYNIQNEYSPYSSVGFINFFITMKDDGTKEKDMISLIANFLKSMKDYAFSKEELNAIKTKIKVNEILLGERFQYYAMDKAFLLTTKGYEFIKGYLNNLIDITIEDIKDVSKRYFNTKSLKWLSATAYPLPASDKRYGNGEVSSHIRNKNIFKNGLTLITDENHDSKVFAVHVLFKNRSLIEPAGKNGIADLLHRMLLKGSKKMDSKQLEMKINSIGASLSVTDNPYIPFDDYYFSPFFSYIRLSTIDEFYEDALELLAYLIKDPEFDPTAIEEVKRDMLNSIKLEETKSSFTASNLFHRMLFSNYLSFRLSGTEESIAAITKDDLEAFHKIYFSPSNMIIAIVSNIMDEEILYSVDKLFGDMKGIDIGNRRLTLTLPASINSKSIKKEMGNGQSYYYLGYMLKDYRREDAAPLTVMNTMLSENLSSNLRERYGIAYSVGSSIGLKGDYNWLEISIGTGRQNLNKAKEEILRELEGMKTAVWTTYDIAKAVNKTKGNILMRQMQRINQAYYLSYNEFINGDYNYTERLLDELSKVTPDMITEISKRYIDTQDYLEVIIE